MAITETVLERARTASVRRTQRSTKWTTLGLGIAVAVLAYLPYVAYTRVTDRLVTFLILLTMASMWNLLTGYAGLVSVGQQAYVGLGAYAVLQLSDWGVQPYLGVFLAAGVCALIALPTSLLAFRLRGDYFAVGTWVIAEVYRLLIVRDNALGGGSGRSLTTLSDMDHVVREAVTYWVALGVAVVSLLGCYLLMRSRLGLALTSVRDDETAARSAGVDVLRAKRIVYLVAAAGCGAAGGVLLVSSLNVHPDAAFSVQWSAFMIFISVIGGIGYVEGPIVGAIVFFAAQVIFADYGSWYLVLLGALAVAGAVWLPGGLWGAVRERTGAQLFPLGYRVTEIVTTSGKSLPQDGSETTTSRTL
jgi:branched-chain amino acid transport system permease protein